jgi:hypothetical protein
MKYTIAFFPPLCLYLFLSVIFLTSCKPGVPNEYIQPNDMENILYDYHVADGMVSQMTIDKDLTLRAYRLAILKKHHVTQSEFDTSMVYYMRHTDMLHDIYEKISKRLSDDAVSLGSSMNGGDKYSSLSENGDTVDVWSGERSFVFVPQAPFNQSSYSLKADSAFHKGDVILLNFDTQFIYQDGMRDGIAVLSVQFGNDSIASQYLHISSSTRSAIQIKDDKHLGIKEIKGFFIQNRNMDAGQSTSTLQIMAVYNIRLIRIHENKLNKTSVNNNDSAKVDTSNHAQPGGQMPNPNNSGMAPNNMPLPPQRPGEAMPRN